MASHMQGNLGQTALSDPMALSAKCRDAMEAILCCLRIAHLLKSGSSLKNNVHFATQLLGFDPEFLRDSSAMVPSASTLCRVRFTVDCGMLLLWRAYILFSFLNLQAAIQFCMLDVVLHQVF